MKGITHFLTGIALATLFPEVVHAAQAGSLLPVLGGLGGLLPDTLDFKFVQFWEDYDFEIDPGPMPDADAIAEAIVNALQTAYMTDQPIHFIAHTSRLRADLWRQYTIEFLSEEREITVRIGPVVSTSQKPYAGSEPAVSQMARWKVAVPFFVPYTQCYKVDIFRGPDFLMTRKGDSVQVNFLDWHHRWTHSLVLAPVVGLMATLMIGWLWGWTAGLWCGLACGLGFGAHVLEDQLGYLGCNLWWPFSRSRTPGLGLFHAGDSLPNFITVCLALILILINLDRYASASVVPDELYWMLAIGGPLLAFLTAVMWKRRSSVAEDAVDEIVRSQVDAPSSDS